jgi:uncharacterized protein (UPF0210 family)
LQLDPEEIVETLLMVQQQSLDIRTITLGLSLRGCAGPDIADSARRVYDRVARAAEHLVPVTRALEREYGIPIVNRRISVTPIAEIVASCTAADATPLAEALDRAANEVGVDFVGGYRRSCRRHR